MSLRGAKATRQSSGQRGSPRFARDDTKVVIAIGLLFFSLASSLLATNAQAVLKPDRQPIDVIHYRLAIDIDEQNTSYHGSVDITFSPAGRNVRQVWFHAERLQISGARFAGAPLKYRQRKGRVSLKLPRQIRNGEEVTVTLDFSGRANARDQQGLFVINHPSRLPAFYTQFETQGARTFFPCFDEPFDKASTEVILTSNAKYTLLSNGKRVGVKQVGLDRKQAHFRNDDPISTYLISLVAAELSPVRSTYYSAKGTIPLTIYVQPGRRGDVQVAMRALREAMAYFEEYFGQPYPWASYGIVAVEGFTWGGMENKGLANINANYLYWNADQPVRQQAKTALIVAHELAHEWFGNLVTMQWWHDLWLNEAFATFMEQKVTAYLYGEPYERVRNFQWLRKDYFPQDQGPLAHPIVVKGAQTIDELFDGVTYTKGVQVVRMLEALVGEENFRRAIQAYITKYRFGNATTDQFLQTIEASTAVPLKHFAASWLHQAGFPQLHLQPDWEMPRQLRIAVVQERPGGGRISKPYVGILQVGVGEEVIDMGLSQVREVFVLQRRQGEAGISVNRDGTFLAEYRVAFEKGHLPELLRREKKVVPRVAALDRLLRFTTDPHEVIPVVRSALREEALALRAGLLWSLLHSGHDTIWTQQIARAVQDELITNLRVRPHDPVGASVQELSLTLLGAADLPDILPLLHARLGHSIADVQLGALAGLLRTSEPTRFTSFAESIRRVGSDQARKLEMLEVLARTPDPQALTQVGRYLGDTHFVAADDSTTPIRVFRVLRQDNRQTAYTTEGITLIGEFTHKNLDRPKVAATTLRTLEGIKAADAPIRQQARAMLQDILSQDPPELVASIGKKILKSAR